MSKLSEAISFYHSLEGQSHSNYATLLEQIKKDFGAKTVKAFAQEIDYDMFARNWKFNLWWKNTMCEELHIKLVARKAWDAAWEFKQKYPYHGPNIF